MVRIDSQSMFVAPVTARMEADLLLLWLLKDLGWVLIIPVLCLFPATIAVGLSSYIVWRYWRASRSFDFAHCLLTHVWLCGNYVWMVADCLFDDPPSALPYKFTPIIRGHRPQLSALYHRGATVALIIFALGLLFIVGYYFSLLVWRRRALQEPLRWGFIPEDGYHHLFVTFWVLKDLCWCLVSGWGAKELWLRHLYWVGIVSGLFTLACVIDAGRRFPESRDVVFYAVEALWIIGNCCWMTEEILLQDSLPSLRFFSAALLLFGACIVFSHTSCAVYLKVALGKHNAEYAPVRREPSVTSQERASWPRATSTSTDQCCVAGGRPEVP